MAKYSTGGNSSRTTEMEEGICELCGESDELALKSIAGAKLSICNQCRSGQNEDSSTEEDENSVFEDMSLKTCREELGMTHTELANLSGVGESVIKAIENGAIEMDDVPENDFDALNEIFAKQFSAEEGTDK